MAIRFYLHRAYCILVFTWIVFSLANAFFESAKNVSVKRSVQHYSPYVVAWGLHLFALPVLLIVLLFTDIPPLTPLFLWALLISGVLNVVTSVLVARALKTSDLSLTSPLISFTPVFLLITSPIIVGELPGFRGIAGSVLIVIGTYVLNISKSHTRFWEPLRALLYDPGCRTMLLVAFIWSITSNFDKIGVVNSSPALWVVAINCFIAVVLSPVALRILHKENIRLRTTIKDLFLGGVIYAASGIAQTTAIRTTYVTYVIAIKRMSSLFDIGWAYFLFKEKNIRPRLIGASIMVGGVLCIVLG